MDRIRRDENERRGRGGGRKTTKTPHEDDGDGEQDDNGERLTGRDEKRSKFTRGAVCGAGPGLSNELRFNLRTRLAAAARQSTISEPRVRRRLLPFDQG